MLQALLGVESMPTSLRLRPFIPSVDGDGTVATTHGDVPLSQTAEYASLVAAGVIGDDGRVDEAVRDWIAVIGRPQREVTVVIRRPPRTAVNQRATAPRRSCRSARCRSANASAGWP